MDAHVGQPGTEGALSEYDDLKRLRVTDKLSNQGMVHAKQLGCQLRNPQLNLAPFLFMLCCWRCVESKPGEVRLDRVQLLLGHVQAADHLDEG